MNSAGQLTGFVSLKRDVTEEVKLEARLRQAQKMEAIGNLAGGIAHDFNNILGAIIGYTELYKDQVRDLPKVYHGMEQVLKAALRARDLVQQILTFSRKTEPRKSPTTVIPIVKEITKFLRASLPANIEIRHSLNATSDLILADPSQIHQVLMNLCTNAGHAMAQTGGILEIGLDEVYILENDYFEFSTLESGRYLHLSVLDTGHGIMPEHLDKIFDPYFTTKSIGEGTGLGLAVVHGIVKDHCGEIRVYSNVGKGTVFHVYLRMIEKRPAKEGPLQPAALPRGKETILFVDDERMLADLGKLLLEELGYTVLAETDAVAAVREFKRRKDVIDLVITDKTMPQMTGLAVAREIRAIRPDVPVILCSGFQTVEDIQAQSDLGILHFINKPIMKHVMAHKVREVLNQKQGMGETPA